MRICLVSLDCFSRRSSGLAVYAETLAVGLSNRGHEVMVVSARGPNETIRDKIHAIDVIRVPIGCCDWISFAWRAGPVVARLTLEYGFDVVHFLDVHFAYNYRGAYVATLFQSFRQRLTCHHGVPSHSTLTNLLSRAAYYSVARFVLEKPAIRKASHLLPASLSTFREFNKHYSVPNQKMTIIPLGIDLSRYAPNRDPAFAEKLGISEHFVLLYVGFCTPRKGLEYLAQAMRRLPQDVMLVIVGRWDPKYKARFRACLGSAANRVVLVGYVPDSELARYYSVADAFVFPSLLEGFGLPLAEALACGLPVISTNISSVPEVVGPGGLLVPPGDVKGLEEAILRLYHMPELRRKLSERGRQWVLARFSQERMIDDTAEVYHHWLRGAASDTAQAI